MDIILIPGLWLDASSWDVAAARLGAAGHRPHPLTMPGTGAPAEQSASIGIDDWVAAVTSTIDGLDGDVVLVGHSGGGNVAYGAADARPDRVRRIVFVDTMPPPPGAMISEFDVVDGVIPFPDWSTFDEPDIADLDDVTRARVARLARDVPASVPTDRITLTDERRRDIPVTILSGGATEAELRDMVSAWPEWAAELEALRDVSVVTLGSGHWPQFSQPEAFADALVDAVDPS